MRLSRWALFAFTICPIIALAGKLPPHAEVLKTLRTIESANLHGEVEPLRVRYREQAQRSPHDAMARVYLAWCAMPSDTAWDELKKVAALYPEVPWPHYGMGRVYLRWKVRDQAERVFRGALGTDRDFYPARIGLADVLRGDGKHAEAEAGYRAVLATHEDAEARAGLGLSLLAQGKVAEARAELSRAVDLWPDQPEVLTALAELARKGNDARGALRYMDRLTRIRPTDREARRAVAELQFELGEKALAAQRYEDLLRLGERDPVVLQRLVGLYEALGDREAMERTLRSLAVLGTDTGPLVQLAGIAEQRGALDEADRWLTEALAREPGKLDLLLRLARMKARRELWVEALDLYRAAQAAGARPDETAEAADIARRFKLPSKPISGTVEQIHERVFAGLNALYTERLRENAGLGGSLEVRVRVDAEGKVLGVEMLEDTVNDTLIAGHVYFVLKGASFPKQRREPLFEFVLRPPVAKGSR